MKLADSEIERFNNYLARDYGYFEGVLPLFRVVWSHDQLEKRRTNYTDEGILLPYFVVKEVPKYRQWCDNRYVLERLTPIPSGVETDMVGTTSYEPVWVFQDKNNEYLPPNYDVIKIVIYSMMHQMHERFGQKYKDPRAEKDWKEMNEEQFRARYKELFGNETNVTDALHTGEAVGYTGKEKDVVN